MSKILNDSEEVLSSDLIVDSEVEPITVRYNALAYGRKIAQQVAEEYQAQPATLRAIAPAPICQLAMPKS